METLGDLRGWGGGCPMPTHRPLWAGHSISYQLSAIGCRSCSADR